MRGTPGQERLPPLSRSPCWARLAGVVFGLARAEGLLIAVPLAGLAIFASELRPYLRTARACRSAICSPSGSSSQSISRSPSSARHCFRAACFSLGSLWAIVLTSLIWRIQTTAPLRRAIGDCYRALAAMAQDMREILAARTGNADIAARWEQNARVFRGDGRVAIESARLNILAFARSDGNSYPADRTGLAAA